MTDLITCIEFIRERQRALPSCDAEEADRKARRAAIETMAAEIIATLPKARITERWDGAVVSILGVRSTSTMGVNAALSNWIAAARRRLDQTGFIKPSGEKENVR